MKILAAILLCIVWGVVATAQNVGIGTATPTHKLTVVTGNDYGLVHKNNTVSIGTYVNSGYGWLGSLSSHPFHLGTGENVHATILTDGNVGIGIQTPQAAFTVGAGKTVLFGSDTLGAGTKMMWIPAKSAFRAGELEEESVTLELDEFFWNPDSVGTNSVALGYNVMAKGDNSFASGFRSKASGFASTALGQSVAPGSRSTATGFGTSNGFVSFASGFYTRANNFCSFVIGHYNDPITGITNTGYPPVPGEPIFIVGDGLGATGHPKQYHNAMVVYNNSNVDHNGYTRLGESTESAPRIKTKKLTGISAATEGGFVNSPHGLNQSKIISVNVIMQVPAYVNVPPSYTRDAEYEFNFQISTTNIVVINIAGNSGNILSKNYTVFITYEE